MSSKNLNKSFVKITLHFYLFGYNGGVGKQWNSTIRLTADRLKRKGRMNMVREIHLTPNEVQHFVNVASRCDFEIDISYNRYIVDAKSFLGVYGLDFRKPLKVSYDGYDRDFEELLRGLAVAS